ncbi:MAG: hypothetical protein WAT46_09940, partial [Saprospiraceae bacterium]
MKHIHIKIIFLLIGLYSQLAFGQINDADRHYVILSGQEKHDTISSKFQPSVVSGLVSNCIASISNIGNEKWKITISPSQGSNDFTGKASAVLQYTDGIKPRWITYHIHFVASAITTSPDFVTIDSDDQIEINPLTNDFTTATSLTLVSISHVQSGTAVLSNGKILYTPATDDDNDFILYSVKDDKGAVANGVVYLLREQSPVALKDTIQLSVLNTQTTYITLPFFGFVQSTPPAYGQIVLKHDQVYQYIPNKGSNNRDVFVLKNGNYERVIVVNILKKTQNTSSLKDDAIFTPKNTSVSFDVFKNDLSTNFPITSFSTELIKGNKGNFTYTPPSGYSGIKNFTYTVNYGNYQAQGKITITVGNYAPIQSVDYTFNTLKNAPLAITYNVPIAQYTFKVLNAPEFGTAEVFDINTTITDECNTIKSKAILTYTPYNNYYGSDSFDIEYCVPNNPCVVYKIYIRVHDHNGSV